MALRFKPEEVRFSTPGVDGARCELTDKRGRKWEVEKTPETVSVSGGAAPLAVICQKRGYKPAVMMVESMGFWKRNDHLPLGGVSMGELSGAQRYYPVAVEVWMEPSTWKSDELRKPWMEQRARSRLRDAQILINPNALEEKPMARSVGNDLMEDEVEEDWVQWMKER